MKVLMIDYETGGVEANRHAPVSLGIALMDGESVLDTKEWIYQRMDNIEPKFKRRSYEVGALEVSGITWSQIKNGTPEHVVLMEFGAFVEANDCQDMPLASHNAVFDQSFYSDWMFRCGDYDRGANAYVVPRSPIGGPWICTMRMAQRLIALPDYKLDTVAAHFDLKRAGEAHSALEDVILAGKVYARLAALAEKRRTA